MDGGPLPDGGSTDGGGTVTGSRLVFVGQPSNTTAGLPINPAVTVAVEDVSGNIVTTAQTTVTISLGSTASDGALLGTLVAPTAAGVATFNDLTIRATGTGYTLVANAGALTSATSAAFDVTAGSATQLAFGTQPSNSAAGAAIAPAVAVVVQDAYGNTVTDATQPVTIALETHPAGAALMGTLVRTPSSGVATFTGLSLTTAGNGYTLSATEGSLTPITSAPFDVTPGAASQLVFAVQPASIVAGQPFTPSVAIDIEDSYGNLLTASTASVTLSLAAGPTGATLSGTLTQDAVAGVAMFAGVSVQTAGPGCTVLATSGSLTATSTAFSVTPGPASQLAFTSEPSGITAGTTMMPAVTVTAEDQYGNLVSTLSGDVGLTLGGLSHAALLGTASQPLVQGVATFGDLTVDVAGTGYELTAAVGTTLSGTSISFDVTAGAAAALAFGTQPTTTTAGAVMTPAVTVLVEDVFGNVVPDATLTVMMYADFATGSAPVGFWQQAAVGGVATFSDVSLQTAGQFELFTVGLTGNGPEVDSAPFSIEPVAPGQLVFRTQPTTITAGAPLIQEVFIEDMYGNTVTTAGGAVTVSLSTDPTGATLNGTLTQTFVSGAAEFNLTIDTAGSGYVLQALSGSYAPLTTSPFVVTPSSVSQLAFSVLPTTVTAGVPFAVWVTAEDKYGNTVPSFPVTVNLTGYTSSDTPLQGNQSVGAANGVAQFNFTIDVAGTYTLTAIGATTLALSSPFVIEPVANEGKLVFNMSATTLPRLATVDVSDVDPYGNVINQNSGTVTLSLSTNPTGAALGGTVTKPFVNGVAAFNDLSISTLGSGYVFEAVTTAGLSSAFSPSFNVEPGWFEQSPATSAPARSQTALAFDSRRGVTVLFGGATQSVLADTWEWDGTIWTPASPASSPPARADHMMAYDSGRGVTVLFGGGDAQNNDLADTWEWDGTNWTEATPVTSPGARTSGGMAYDSSRSVTVLYGGSNGPGRYTDTWEWDGTNWTNMMRATNPPAMNTAPGMAFDSGRNVTVLFGVALGETSIPETWEWDGNSWTQAMPATVPTVGIPSLVYDSQAGISILYDGFYLETWEWNGTNWAQPTLLGPEPTVRFDSAIAYDSQRGATVLFGGDTYQGYLADTWEFLNE
jgi:hypothetical protein